MLFGINAVGYKWLKGMEKASRIRRENGGVTVVTQGLRRDTLGNINIFQRLQAPPNVSRFTWRDKKLIRPQFY